MTTKGKNRKSLISFYDDISQEQKIVNFPQWQDNNRSSLISLNDDIRQEPSISYVSVWGFPFPFPLQSKLESNSGWQINHSE